MEPDNTETTNKNDISFAGKIGRDFFLGCAALVPLALLVFLFCYLLNVFEAVGQLIFGITHSLRTTAAISAIIVLMLIYIGRKIRRRERSIFSMLEQHVITKIPVVGGWYATFRDIIRTFTSGGGDKGYLGTVKIPAAGGYIIGFVSNREESEDGGAQVTVFVPTSPNPTTGLVFFIDEDKVEYLDLTPEKAFTKIISLGIKS